MKIAPDKIAHLAAGAKAAAFGGGVGAIGALLFALVVGLDAGTTALLWRVSAGMCALMTALAAGLAKEYADAQNNKRHPGMHVVEAADVAFTAAPGAVLCAYFLIAAAAIRMGGL